MAAVVVGPEYPPEAGIEVPPEALEAARELAATARAVAATLPFGAEPADFLRALERLAEPEEDGAASPESPAGG